MNVPNLDPAILGRSARRAPTAAACNASERPFLSLVFPVFDEEINIAQLIPLALRIGTRLAQDHDGDFEVVIVDDGSRDRSGEIIDAWCRRNSRVRVVRHDNNTGYGAALRSGLRVARGERIFFSDSDLQFDLDELHDLVEHSDRFEIVAGFRSPRRDPWPRRALAVGWGTLVRLLFGLRIRDIDCAFKLFRRETLDAIPIASVGAFINTEILVRAKATGARIHQVPVTHHPRRHGQQTGANPRVIARAVLELLSLFRELRRIPKRSTARLPRKPGRAPEPVAR